MTTITLKYHPEFKAFRVVGTALYFGPARADEFDDVAEYLGNRLCNNPDAQAALGVLGADSVEFTLAA